MSLPAMSLGLRFCTEGGGRVAEIAWLLLGLAMEKISFVMFERLSLHLIVLLSQ